MQTLQQATPQQFSQAAQEVANEEAVQKSMPNQAPEIVQQATADFMRGMDMKKFESLYPELMEQSDVFANFHADLQKNPPADKLM